MNRIYGLIDPRTEEIRYIGKSSRGMRRAYQHAYEKYKGKGEKARWIASLQEEGLSYEIITLENVSSREELDARETWWIAWYRPLGRLTNVSAGGSYEADAQAGGFAAQAAMTEKEKIESIRRLHASRDALPPERRSEKARRGNATRAAEQRRNIAHRATAHLTHEQRSFNSKKGASSPEQRKARSIRAITLMAALTPEQRSERARNATNHLSKEQKRANACKASHAMSKEERSTQQRRLMAIRSDEKRSQIARKGWETRRASQQIDL